MADTRDAAPIASHAYGTPPVDVTELYQPTPAYVVIGLTQETRVRPRDGKLIPTIAVLFRVPGLPSTHTIRIDNYAFTHADPLEYMNRRAYLIRELYALPARLPPYESWFQAAGGPIVGLTSATATTQAGTPAVAWAGTVNPQGLDATAVFELLHLPDNEVYFSSDPLPVAAAPGDVAVAGTLADLTPGSYLARLSATNANGAGVAATLPVTVR